MQSSLAPAPLFAALALAASACSSEPIAAAQQFDTGNMAFPAPLPQGNITATRVR